MSDDTPLEYFGGGWRRVEAGERSRVIDTHCHVFPRLSSSKGWDPAIHIRLWQNHMRDYTTFWRKEDGVRVDGPLLDYPSDDIYEMPDLDFRMADHGRAEFAVDGVEQSLDHIAVHCDFLTQRERDQILGGNAARILKL